MDQGPEKVVRAVDRVAVDAGGTAVVLTAIGQEDPDAETESGEAAAVFEASAPRCAVCGMRSAWLRHEFLSRRRRASARRAQAPP
jgi:hypothetical protein